MGQTSAERQRAYKERQKALGRKQVPFIVTDDERFYLERTLEALRKFGGIPATIRDAKGRYQRIDI